jgi:hypothetical protein
MTGTPAQLSAQHRRVHHGNNGKPSLESATKLLAEAAVRPNGSFAPEAVQRSNTYLLIRTHPASTPGAMTTAKRSGSNGGL